MEEAWALIGDFNSLFTLEECSSNSGVSSSFAEWIDRKGLLDMGFVGPKFIWCHGNEVYTRRAARLDRGLCDVRWRSLFSSATIHPLAYSYSDHCPLLMCLEPNEGRQRGCRPFRFVSAWIRHRGFFSMVEKEWEKKECPPESLKCFSEKLLSWNKDTFGNIFQRKRRCSLRLEGV